MPPQTSPPLYANFPSSKLTIGAGVAIFHLATERVVVVCIPSVILGGAELSIVTYADD